MRKHIIIITLLNKIIIQKCSLFNLKNKMRKRAKMLYITKNFLIIN